MKDKKAKSKGSDKSGDTVKGQPVKAGPFPELVSCAKPPKEGIDKFVSRVLPLLELEKDAEVQQSKEAASKSSPESAQRKGLFLLNLRFSDAEGGLLGRTLLTLVPNKPGPLPAHKFGPHDVVDLRPNKGDSSGDPLCSGVIYRCKDDAIVVAVDDYPDEGMDQPLRLEKLANEVTYNRCKLALERIGNPSTSSGAATDAHPGCPLIACMFGARAARFSPKEFSWTPINGRLDPSQTEAISLALACQDFSLIHGPPGTGKTTAVVELILQEVLRGNRVLACAASNVAVDNLVERIASLSPKTKVVRLGHPARLLPSVLENSLEAHVNRADATSLAADCRKEVRDLNARLGKLGRKDYAERRQIRSEIRQLNKDRRVQEQKAIEEVLSNAHVLCCTLTGAASRDVERMAFDLVVIDEAAQAIEPACWIPLLRARRAVLAGDHLQLPPTVMSEEAARKGLARTLFERLQEQFGGGAVGRMLTVQYRMHEGIMRWSSDELYGGRLTAHASVACHTLADLRPAMGDAAATLPVLLLIDTTGCDMPEKVEDEGDSKWNEGEAKVVISHVQRLVAAGVRPDEIGIITPYNAQVAVLRELRTDALRAVEISSVDGFQGREKEAIVISTVRSNATREVGFLADHRRFNVAVTRARRHCAVVADAECIATNAFLKRLVDYFSEHGAYASAAEYVE